MICTIAGVWGTYILQNSDTRELRSTLNTLKNQNSLLKLGLFSRDSTLDRIRSQNEFLIEQMIIISKQQKEFNVLARNIYEASRIKQVRESESTKPASTIRGIDKQNSDGMLFVLSKHKGATIILTCVLGDQESFQFANQLKQLFTIAGWKVNGVNQALYTQPVIGIFVKVKNQQYPKRVDSIVDAFKILNINLEGFIDNSLNADDVELIVGARKS